VTRDATLSSQNDACLIGDQEVDLLDSGQLVGEGLKAANLVADEQDADHRAGRQPDLRRRQSSPHWGGHGDHERGACRRGDVRARHVGALRSHNPPVPVAEAEVPSDDGRVERCRRPSVAQRVGEGGELELRTERLDFVQDELQPRRVDVGRCPRADRGDEAGALERSPLDILDRGHLLRDQCSSHLSRGGELGALGCKTGIV